MVHVVTKAYSLVEDSVNTTLRLRIWTT